MSEALRFERLRAQDGKPFLPPPNLRGLCAGGGLAPDKHDETHAMWQAALAEIQTAPSFPTEERLFWTAFLLARHYTELGQRQRLAPLVDATLPWLREARHQQTLLGMLVRNAAFLGDHATAAQLAARLDPYSDDLQIDSCFRFSSAYAAIMRDDPQAALAVLGTNIDDVPISEAYDKVCGVYRAHAHERLGRLDLAQTQLARLAPTPAALSKLESMAMMNPSLQLCPQSLQAARQRVKQLHDNVVVTQSGINVKMLVLVPLVGSALAVGGGGLAASVVGTAYADVVQGVLVAAIVIVTMVTVLRALFRGPALRKQLAQTGVAGSAELLVVEQTGTRVNDQPMLRLRMLVHLPNKPPYTALHHEIVAQIHLSSIGPGVHVPVRVDPNDPTRMAIAWS